MASSYSERLKSSVTEAPQTALPGKPAVGEGGYSERLRGLIVPSATREQVSPLSSAARGAGLGDIAVASLADDPQARARFYAEQRGLPLERYRVVEGRVAYQDDDGQWYYERPNARLNDPQSWFKSLAGGVGPSIPAVTGTAAGLGALPLGLGTSIPAAAAGGYMGQGIREELAEQFVGQEATPGEQFGRMAQQAAIEGAGQGIGVGMTAYAQRGVAPDIARLDRPQAEQLTGRAAARGVQLTPAEATGLPSLRAEQKALGNLPGSSDVMGEFYERRAGQVAQAVGEELERIAPETGVETAGALARAGSRGAMQAVAANRAAQASPLYQKAFAEAGDVNLAPVLKYTRNIIRAFPQDGQVARTLNRAFRLLTREVKTPQGIARAPETNLERLHNAKLEIDQMLEATGESSLGRTTRARLMDVRNRLLAAMDEASPTYGNARALFADLSPGVERIREGILGVISDLPDHRLQTAVTRLFSAPGIAPQEVRSARNALMRHDPVAWQQIKRAWLEEQWMKAGRETLSASPRTNQGALFRKAVMGDPRQRANLEAMLEPSERESLYELMDILRATGSVKPVGSDTAWNQEAMKLLRQKVEPWIARALRYLSRAEIRERIVDEAVYRNAERMAEVITSPGALDRLRELRRLPTSSAVKRVLLGHFLANAGDVMAEEALEPSGVVEPVQ